MERISKQDMDYMIERKILKLNKQGNYIDSTGKQIVVTGKYGNARGKQRFAPDPLYNKLLKLKLQDKINRFFMVNNFVYNSMHILKANVNGKEKIFSFDFVVFEDSKKTKIKFLVELHNNQFTNEDMLEYCKDNRINLLRIKHDEFTNIKELLSSVS